MARFDNAIALAQRLIQKNGRTVTLKFESSTDVDPAKPFEGKVASTSTLAVKAVFTRFKRDDQNRNLDGVTLTIQAGDQKCLIAAGDLGTNDIKTATLVTDRGTDWKILDVSVVDPGDDSILYALQLRA